MVAVTLVVSTAGAPVTAATTREGQVEAHSGTHGSFETTGDAIVDYRVDGETVVEELRVQSRSEASGAEIESHDNDRGIVVVRSNGSPHVAQFNGSDDSEAEQASEERSDSEKRQERMIANGTAVAEAYLQAAAESAGEAAEDRSADVVRYGGNTTVEVTEQSANTFNATVERTETEGEVVIMSVQEAPFGNAENVQVYVDGEAAAEASTDVVVGIDGFSARKVSMQSEDSGHRSAATQHTSPAPDRC